MYRSKYIYAEHTLKHTQIHYTLYSVFGFDSRLGHFATPFSKEFNLAMLTMVTLASGTAALRAAWDKHS